MKQTNKIRPAIIEANIAFQDEPTDILVVNIALGDWDGREDDADREVFFYAGEMTEEQFLAQHTRANSQEEWFVLADREVDEINRRFNA